MRFFRYISLSAVMLVIPAVASASVVFTDGFTTGPHSFTGTDLTHTGVTGNFVTAFNTNVDELGKNGGFASYCASGLSCVDLGGTGGNSYGFITTPTGTFTGTKYLLSFFATATPGYADSKLFVQFGSYARTFDFSQISSHSINVVDALVLASPGDSLTFGYMPVAGGNANAGPILSSVSVTSTPEPSSLALLGTGLLSSVGMMTRRRKA